MKVCFSCVFLLTILFQTTSGNFRGAMLTWKPIENSTQIMVTYRIGWRLRTLPHIECTLRSSVLNAGASSVYVQIPGQKKARIKSANYFCNGDVSPYNDWLIGENAFTFTPPPGLNTFHVGFSDCCWKGISNLEVAKAKWQMWTSVDVSKKNSNNRINSSPISSFFPVVYAIAGCEFEWKLPVYDADDDVVKCRFAVGYSECGNACNNLPNAKIDEFGCKLTFTAPPTLERYVVAVQVEDFDSPLSKKPKSSVAVQFVVMILKNKMGASCEEKPTLTFEKDGRETCLNARVGEEIKFETMSKSYNSDDPVVEILTSTPFGTKQPTVTMNDDETKANMYWTPSSNGSYFFCFAATTKYRRLSDQHCTLVKVGGDNTSIRTNKGRISRPVDFSNVSITIPDIVVEFRKSVKLSSSDKIEATIFDSQSYTVLEINRDDLMIEDNIKLKISLKRLQRKYGEKYNVRIGKLVDNDGYCHEEPSMDDFAFTLTSKRENVSSICRRDGFSFKINKFYHAPFEITQAHLFDPKCTADYNQNHVTISTNYNQCWTRVDVNISHVTYTNSFYYVLDKPNDKFSTSNMEKKEINCVFERLFPTESNSVEEKLDKHFESTFSNVSAANLIPKSKVGRVLVTFAMYLDEDFRDRYYPFEFPLKLKNIQKLYFGVSMDNNDVSAKLVLDDCYVTTTQGVDRERYYFVKKRCPDEEVLNIINMRRDQIQFSLNPVYAMHLLRSGVYFHCEVTVCHWCSFGCNKKSKRWKRALDSAMSMRLSTGKFSEN